MSNSLYIEVIESRIVGSDDPFTYSLRAHDAYGSWEQSGYDNLESLFKDHPNRLDVMYTLGGTTEFEEAFDIEGHNTIILNSISSVTFSGFPEDGTISKIKKL